MAIYKATYSEKYRRLTLHNHLCNFRCTCCTYKLKGSPSPERFFSLSEIADAVRGLEYDAVHFMGGEPTTNKDLPELLRYFKQEARKVTWLGHTNGSKLVTEDLDGTNVSLKFFRDDHYVSYTGHHAAPIYSNFEAAHAAGLEMKASTVFIPGLMDYAEFEQIVSFVGALDRRIPFHIMGFVPTPGAEWRRPTEAEMQQTVDVARRHLDNVGFSHLTVEQLMNTESRDDRFVVRRVL